MTPSESRNCVTDSLSVRNVDMRAWEFIIELRKQFRWLICVKKIGIHKQTTCQVEHIGIPAPAMMEPLVRQLAEIAPEARQDLMRKAGQDPILNTLRSTIETIANILASINEPIDKLHPLMSPELLAAINAWHRAMIVERQDDQTLHYTIPGANVLDPQLKETIAAAFRATSERDREHAIVFMSCYGINAHWLRTNIQILCSETAVPSPPASAEPAEPIASGDNQSLAEPTLPESPVPEQRSEDIHRFTGTIPEVAAHFAESLGTPAALEKEHTASVHWMNQLITVPDHPLAREIDEIFERCNALPCDTVAELQEYYRNFPDDVGTDVQEIIHRIRNVSGYIYQELEQRFPYPQQARGNQLPWQEQERRTRSLLRSMAVLSVILQTACDKGGTRKPTDVQQWTTDLMNSSVMQSLFISFVQRSMPDALMRIPRGEHDTFALSKQHAALRQLYALIMKDIAPRAEAFNFTPVNLVSQAAKNGIGSLWILQHYGNLLTRSEPRERNPLHMDPKKALPLHFFQTQHSPGAEAPTQVEETEWNIGVGPHIAATIEKQGNAAAKIWLWDRDGEPCHAPSTVIPLSAILPERSSPVFAARNLAGAADAHMHIVLESSKQAPIGPHMEHLRQKGVPLRLIAMFLADEQGHVDESEYATAWLLPKEIADELHLQNADLPEQAGLVSGRHLSDDLVIVPAEMPTSAAPHVAENEDVTTNETVVEKSRETISLERRQRASTLLKLLYPNKSNYDIVRDVLPLLSLANIERSSGKGFSGRGRHFMLMGPFGTQTIPEKGVTKAYFVAEKLAIGDLDSFERWVNQQPQAKKKNGNGAVH